MKILNSRKIDEKVMSVIDITGIRTEISRLSDAVFMLEGQKVEIPSDDFEKLKKFYRSYSEKEKMYLSENQFLMYTILSSVLDLEDLGRQTDFQTSYLFKVAEESKIFTSVDFADNPYYKNIDFREKVHGDYQLCYDKYLPFEFSFHDVPKVYDGIDIPRICFFTDEFEYPTIRKISTGETLMSVTPNEVSTMQKPIENARKKVLTLGLGTGYYAYMASLKENVKSVTVIEKEQDVIDLFETNILPQFKNKDKIRIIKANAIEYLDNIKDGEYDYCFADIWLGMYDIALYFAIKEIGRKFRKMKIDYWIEESFANQLIPCVRFEMLNAFYRNFSFAPDIPRKNTENKLLMRKSDYVHRLLRDVEIRTPDDVDFYMKPENLIKLINKTKKFF